MKSSVTYEVWEQTGGFAPQRVNGRGRWSGGLFTGLTLEQAEARKSSLEAEERKRRESRPEATAVRYSVVRATTTYEEV